ncbi:MAG: SDR family NAD(P)-dependent oxidoreductase [Anaerolineales bacterium]|nr:SDR family NAD(P)-dependent oxidoreductase [Anaerolineales bacterium]
MNNQTKIVLITGANSGIGIEAAAQFAEAGYGTIILACRTLQKAETAQKKLVQRVGKDVFEGLAIDVAEKDSALTAAKELQSRGHQLDVLVLNAAMSAGKKPLFNADGIEMTFASSLIGHHVLTMSLLNNGQLVPDAHIIIAGSEGARNDVPGMSVLDFNKFAVKHFDGNLEKAHEAVWKIQSPYKFKALDTYVTSKVYVAWWSEVLADKLPAGMIVNTVSPGSVPDTNFARHQTGLMKYMMPMMKLMPKSMGMAGSVAQGARRYVDAVQLGANTNGKFFGSPPRKLVGKLQVQTTPHFYDQKNQQASWNMLTRLTGISLN